MPKEKLPSPLPENMDVATLYSGTKMRYILEAFDLGKGTKEEKQARKNKFIELMRSYYDALKRSKVSSDNQIPESDAERAEIHNKIMDIIRNISLSREVSSSQRKIAEFLAVNRDAVTEMISAYFSSISTTNPQQNDMLRQAQRGDSYFTGRREED